LNKRVVLIFLQKCNHHALSNASKMKLTYSISAADHLNYQLYLCSESPKIRKKRARKRKVLPVAFAVISLFFILESQSYGFALGYLLFAIIWYILYPFWERKVYTKHYQNYILDTKLDHIGRSLTVEFIESKIHSSDTVNLFVFDNKETTEIIETPQNLFVRLKGGMAIIIPKDQVNLEETTKFLKQFAVKLKVPYFEKLDWKWK